MLRPLIRKLELFRDMDSNMNHKCKVCGGLGVGHSERPLCTALIGVGIVVGIDLGNSNRLPHLSLTIGELL